jgi:hypothetical protein
MIKSLLERIFSWVSFGLSVVIIFCCGFADSVSDTNLYTIGVGITGDTNAFLRQWKPLLVNYLTSQVGSLYNPPIEFEIIPVDYDINTSTSILIPDGALDFVCKLHCE